MKKFIFILFKYYFCLFIYMIISAGILFHFYPDIANQLNNGMNDYLEKLGKFALFFCVLIGPMCEELMFRLPINLKKTNIILGLLTTLLYTISAFIDKKDLSLTIFLIMIGYYIYLLKYYYLTPQKTLEIRKHKIYMILGSVLAFTFIHLENIDGLNMSNYAVGIFLNIPIFIIAVFLTYMRCKLGFKYGFIMHAINNFIMICLN